MTTTPDLTPLFWPRSIAVVGASPDTEIIRGKLLQVLRQHGFAGEVFPVSRSHREVQGLRAYGSIADVPRPVDLAVIVVPAAVVPETLAACGERGVRAAIVITSGFAEEQGADGPKRQDAVREIAARYGMMVCGPNCEGVANLLAPMVATFSPALEHPGGPLLPELDGGRPIGVLSQSGGVSFAYFNRGRPKQLRFSYIVSTGNEATLEGLDYVDWMLGDGRTDLFLMYVESIKSAAKFRAVAARAADAGKPLIVAKVGRSDVGKHAVLSHTGSLAGSDEIYDAMFRHYGVVRCDDLDEMLDTAAAFAFCALPRGRRVAVLSGSGGGAVWMADILASRGLELPELDADTRRQIEALIPAYGASRNPVDVTAGAIREIGYAPLIDILARAPMVDMVLVVGSLAAEARLQRQIDKLAQAVKDAGKPVLFTTYTLASERSLALLAGAGIPAYTSLPNCARALAALATYAAFQERWVRGRARKVEADARSTPPPDVARRLREPGRVLCEDEAKDVLSRYGVPRPPEELAATEDEAVAAALGIGFPVALKVQSAAIPHKTEAGGVALGLGSVEAVRSAYRAILARARSARPHAAIHGVLVQKMAPRGIETIVGVSRDPGWGPMLMVGLGGIHVDVLRDVVLAPVPLAPHEARRLIGRLRAAKLFDGVRGEPPADVDALAELITNVSVFAAEQVDLVAEVDLNPVIVHPAGHGLSVVDALIVTTKRSERPPDPSVS